MVEHKMISVGPDDKIIISQIEEICKTEGKKFNFSKIVFECLTRYVKEHGDGNPASKITDFYNPNFIVTPALFRDADTIRDYINKIHGTPEWKKLEMQLTLWGDIFEEKSAVKVL